MVWLPTLVTESPQSSSSSVEIRYLTSLRMSLSFMRERRFIVPALRPAEQRYDFFEERRAPATGGKGGGIRPPPPKASFPRETFPDDPAFPRPRNDIPPGLPFRANPYPFRPSAAPGKEREERFRLRVPGTKCEEASEPVGRPSNFPAERTKTYSIFVRPCQLTWCSLMPISSIQRRVSNVFRWAVLMPAPASLFHTQLGVGHRQTRNLIDL